MIHVYTGNGKGKTTAAVGQGIRGAGRGLSVHMIQFLKNCDTGELHCIEKLENFNIYRFGSVKGFFNTLTQDQKALVKQETNQAFEFASQLVATSGCDIIILDEIMCAILNGLVSEQDVICFLDKAPPCMEIILTGRCAPAGVIDKAHYVSEITEIKHPYQQGIPARVGIEF